MSWLRNPWLHRIAALGLGAIFLYASWSKVLDPRPLVTIIWNYRLLPPGPINAIAIYLPWMELLVGLALISGIGRRGAGCWASLLMTGFTVALLINAVRGLDVACGCFSTSATETHNAWFLVLRDLPMLAAAFLIWLAPPETGSTTSRAS
jgi:uncharacterized membrane protein YphA (DoxX/SURF4 family)